MKNILPRLLLAAVCFASAPSVTTAQTSVPYDWKNVQINGGGFVSGVVYSKAAPNLIYARTDVGGAYRWENSSQMWRPLTDQITADDGNYTGVLSIAADPSDSNRVYLATGLYTQWWAGTAAILSSTNKGESWTVNPVSFKLGGNEDGRSAGERMQVDPNAGNILYLGTSKDGLWKSTDYGVTWNKVTSFPVATTTGSGISFVLFDKASGAAGTATPVIYVGVLETGTNFYKSTDGGVTWQSFSLPNTSLMPHQAALASNGVMYIAASNGPGPNGVTSGDVYKFNTLTSGFSSVSPPTGQGGYGGVSVDAQNPDVVLVSTIDRWYPRDEIFRTTNGGNSWKGILTTGNLDNSSAAYSSASTPHWTGDVDIDPFNSANAWFITGYGLFNSNNIAVADQNTSVTWAFRNQGLEETVPLALISPPTGAPLVSAVADIDGFKHDNLDVAQAARLNPLYGTNTSIEFAESVPAFMVRTHYNSSAHFGAYSTNGGTSWIPFGSNPATNGGGKIAVSASGTTIVWTPDNSSTYYSTNNGTSWNPSAGSPVGFAPVADRVNANKVYIYNAGAGQVLVSTNGGASFSTAATGLNTVPDYLYWMTDMKAVFGNEGDLWLGNPDGLYHSVNSGASFSKLSNVQQARKIALGKAAAGQAYPAIFIVGKINNAYGFFRSDDAGATWVRINDNQHQFGSINAMTADRNVFGRVYYATGGRGIIYGAPAVSLPVTLTTLKAQLLKMENQDIAGLTWETKTETNNKLFDIERSFNTSDWSRIKSVPTSAVNGNSATTRVYYYNDNVTSLSGKIYYRLRQVNADGQASYSNIASVSKGDNKFVNINVSPNPITGNSIQVHVNSYIGQIVQVRVVNMGGAVVYLGKQILALGDTRFTVDAARLAKGTYLVEVVNAGKEVLGSVKFVK